MRTTRALFIMLLVVVPVAAFAQSPEPRLQDVFVRSTDGVELRGRLLDFNAVTLSLFIEGARRDVPIDSVDRIQTRGDSVWNGALVGAAIGGGLVGVMALQHGGEYARYVVGAAMGYGLLGAGVDALIPGRTTIYSKVPSAPAKPAGKRAGLAVKIGF